MSYHMPIIFKMFSYSYMPIIYYKYICIVASRDIFVRYFTYFLLSYGRTRIRNMTYHIINIKNSLIYNQIKDFICTQNVIFTIYV